MVGKHDRTVTQPETIITLPGSTVALHATLPTLIAMVMK